MLVRMLKKREKSHAVGTTSLLTRMVPVADNTLLLATKKTNFWQTKKTTMKLFSKIFLRTILF